MMDDPAFADYGADRVLRPDEIDDDFVDAVVAVGERLPTPRPGNGGGPKLTEADLANIVVLENLQPVSATELLATELPEPEQLIGRLLFPSAIMVVGGLVKVRKTWLLIQLALSLVSGTPFLGHQVSRKLRVLYVGAEGTDLTLRSRLLLAIGHHPVLADDDLEHLFVMSTLGRLKIDTPAGENWLTRVSEGFDVVILDPYYRFLSIGSENDHADQRAVQDVLDRVKARGTAIVLAHHLRKPQGVDAGAAELRGAGLDAFADSILILSRKKTGSSERFALRYVLRHAEELDDLELVPNGPLLQVAEPAERIVTGADVASVIQEAGGRVEGRQAIVEALQRLTGASDGTARRAIQEAEAKGIIWSAKRTGPGQGRTYVLKGNAP